MTRDGIYKNLKTLKIKSEYRLLEYLDFCIEKGTKNTKGKTSHHHILPNKLFDEYSNLNFNSWNGVHLLYSDHYYAHWLLTEAIDNYSMLSAFTAMHNKDIKNGRITEIDLIPLEEFQLKMEEKGRLHRIFLRENKEKISKSMIISQNIIIDYKGEKMTVAQARGKEQSKRLKADIILPNGNISNISKESGKKHSDYLNKEITINGETTTKAKERGKARSKLLTENGKWYNIHSIYSGLIIKAIPRKEVVKISGSLLKTSELNYLGKSDKSKLVLNKNNNLHCVGYYIEEIKKVS